MLVNYNSIFLFRSFIFTKTVCNRHCAFYYMFFTNIQLSVECQLLVSWLSTAVINQFSTYVSYGSTFLHSQGTSNERTFNPLLIIYVHCKIKMRIFYQSIGTLCRWQPVHCHMTVDKLSVNIQLSISREVLGLSN